MKQALLIVDLQNDFLPGGALEVSRGDEVIPVINELSVCFDIVLSSLDWHPQGHVSFAETWGKNPGDTHQNQALWPTHCVQNTFGSAYPISFEKSHIQEIFYKGHNKNVDSYSIFFDQNKNAASTIHAHLKKEGIDELFIVGLATDYCVLETVLDALNLGYKVSVVQDACRAVNINSEDEEKAYEKMKEKGAFLIKSSDLSHAPGVT